MQMNGKGNGLTPSLAGKQHSVIRDSLPQRNSPKLIIREHHPPRHPYKPPRLNRLWISGNKKTICLFKEQEKGAEMLPSHLRLHLYDFIINYSAMWIMIDYCLSIPLCPPSPP